MTRTQDKDREASESFRLHHDALIATIQTEFPPGRRVKWRTYARGGKGVHWHHGRVEETARFGTSVRVRNTKTQTVQDKEAKDLELDEPITAPPDPLTPEIDAAGYSLGDLHTALITGRLSLPLWIRSGRSRHRVTLETRDAFCRGLLLALEMNSP
jgi:hypothetical protein